MNKDIKKNTLAAEQASESDLKHDSMEYAARADGDDKLDFDDVTYEEEEIAAAELEQLQEDSPEDQAYAQVPAETDKQVDSDNLPEEDWQDNLSEGNIKTS